MDFQAARYLMKGEVPEQVGNDHPTSMPTSAYKTADGYINVGASGDGMWKRLCEAIGRPDLARAAGVRGPAERARRTARPLNAELNEALATRSSAEWIAILNEAGVPCGPIYSVDQVFADPQVQHLEAAASGEAPGARRVRIDQPGGEALAHAGASLATATPELGEHTDEVLREWASSDEIAGLRERHVI